MARLKRSQAYSPITTNNNGNKKFIHDPVDEDFAQVICRSIYYIMATNTGRRFNPGQLQYGILRHSYLPENLSRVEIVSAPICNANHDPDKPIGYIMTLKLYYSEEEYQNSLTLFTPIKFRNIKYADI